MIRRPFWARRIVEAWKPACCRAFLRLGGGLEPSAAARRYLPRLFLPWLFGTTALAFRLEVLPDASTHSMRTV